MPEYASAKSDFLRNSSQCAKYFSMYEREHALPIKILKAIATQESGRWSREQKSKVPWPWTINVHGKGYYFPNKLEAIAAVKKFQSQGIRSIDVGCMQVNLKYHGEHFRNVEEAISPRYNIAYSAKLLKSHYKRKSSWKKAVASYHSGGGRGKKELKRGRKYAKKVLTVWRNEINAILTKYKSKTSSSNRIDTNIMYAKAPTVVFKPKNIPDKLL
jgi:hypothetical protein